MSDYIDLSHDFYDGMPGFKLLNNDGTYTQYTASIRPFLTHEQTKPNFENNVSFEISQLEFQSSVGTYLDSPYHRYPDKNDISKLELSDVILEGLVIDAQGCKPWEKLGSEVLGDQEKVENRAVLFNFGWDKYWGKDQYFSYPFISEDLITLLVDRGARLVGVDTINIDSSKDLTRPAHSRLLKQDILIVENLTNLHQLLSKSFRFYAVPIKARGVAAMPVRAFAEVLSE